MIYNGPKVSVIIPVYNTREYLPACLESVKKQTIGIPKTGKVFQRCGTKVKNQGTTVKEYGTNNNKDGTAIAIYKNAAK